MVHILKHCSLFKKNPYKDIYSYIIYYIYFRDFKISEILKILEISERSKRVYGFIFFQKTLGGKNGHVSCRIRG